MISLNGFLKLTNHKFYRSANTQPQYKNIGKNDSTTFMRRVTCGEGQEKEWEHLREHRQASTVSSMIASQPASQIDII